jgi:predicted DNA binding CopG/RHH family protein
MKAVNNMKKKMLLDEEEREILATYEAGDYKSVPNQAKLIKKYAEYAKNTLKKDKRVNIRLSGNDLEHLQNLAVQEGLPYQTLIASLIHKYVTGKLVEKRGV